MRRAHRVAFFLEHGRWPMPFCLHSCDNPPCCNPRHLHEGTQKQNVAECRARGRRVQLAGEQHGMAKLDRARVLAIDGMKGVASQRKIAKLFRVCPATVAHIHSGRQWGSVTERSFGRRRP